MPELSLPSFRDKDDPEDQYERDLLGFLNDAIVEGEAFLHAQQNYSSIQTSVDAIMGNLDSPRSTQLASTRSNRIAKVAQDLVGLLTDVRPFWEYRSAPGSPFEATANNLGRLSQHWYTMRQIDMRFADVIRYWSVAGTGYAHQFWNPDTLDCDMSAEDPRDVIPLRPTGYESLQTALGVCIRRQRTTNYIKESYDVDVPPDRDGSIVGVTGNTRVGKFLANIGSPFWEHLTKDRTQREIPKI